MPSGLNNCYNIVYYCTSKPVPCKYNSAWVVSGGQTSAITNEVFMIKEIFGDVKSGQLRRMAYLGYWVLLTAVMIGFGFTLVLAIGAGETLIGGDLTQAQDKLRAWFTLPTVVIVSVISMLALFGHLNIMAKRIRDIGLPGWWLVLGLAILGGILTAQFSEQASNALSLLVWLALLAIPGGFFGHRH